MTWSTKYSLYGFEKLLPVGAKCIPLGKMWEVRFQNAYIYINRNTAIIAINKRNVIEGIKFSKKNKLKE